MSRVLNGTNQITYAYGNGHSGIDLVRHLNSSSDILAHSEGIVVYVQTGYANNKGSTGNASYGNLVKLKHPNGMFTLYAHLEHVSVNVGDKVTKGMIIGKMGNSGNSYGTHLHFEVRSVSDTVINPSSYINSDLPDLIYSTQSSLKVIDVSEFQGDIKWDLIKDKIDGVILRCGFGSNYTQQDDTKFKANAYECTRLGIPFGVYLYSYAYTEEMAKSEAEHILRLVEPYKLSFPIYLDCEEEANTKVKYFAKQACEIVGNIIESKGYWFGVYANLNWWRNYLQGLDQYTKWVAQYHTSCTYEEHHDMWQYTDKGNITGLSGHVDVNECYLDFPTIINGSAPEEPSKYKEGTYVVNCAVLNVRHGPSTLHQLYRFSELTINAQEQIMDLLGYEVNGYCKGVTCTVHEVRNNWGRTNSGWICLDYCELKEDTTNA